MVFSSTEALEPELLYADDFLGFELFEDFL